MARQCRRGGTPIYGVGMSSDTLLLPEDDDLSDILGEIDGGE